uniref:Uncharacterized protein n=1 Tax=Ditylenchus dipsaci TaxID=166011 RepID=A0A915DDU3_9BILA
MDCPLFEARVFADQGCFWVLLSFGGRYNGMVQNQIASEFDDPFFQFPSNIRLPQRIANFVAPLYKLETWNVNKHIVLQRPVTNNAVESWNKEYTRTFVVVAAERSKVIRHQMDEEEAVRHLITRHERKRKNIFATSVKQLESEERIHAIVNEWNAQRKEHPGRPSDEKLLEFLRSIQDSLCYPRETNPDTDEYDEDEEDEENILHLMPDINFLSIVA